MEPELVFGDPYRDESTANKHKGKEYYIIIVGSVDF